MKKKDNFTIGIQGTTSCEHPTIKKRRMLRANKKLHKWPIAMAEEYWADSFFSVARYTGQISIDGNTYIIVNKHGATIFELSSPQSKYYVGDDNMAIPPGEPCDLVMAEWIPIYKKLGRDKFIELIKQDGITFEKAKEYISKKQQR